MTDHLLASDLNHLVWEFLLSGGVFMWLIVLCSMVASAIIIHRLLSVRREVVMPRALLAEIESASSSFQPDRLSDLRAEAVASESALGEIAAAALDEDFGSVEEARGRTEAVAREEVLRLQSGLSILEDIITIAPLLGLLGTVSGLVGVFAELGISGAAGGDPGVLAGGIARALNTTIAGLSVAVPAVVARSFFQKKIESMAVRMEIILGHLIQTVYRPEPESADSQEPAEDGEPGASHSPMAKYMSPRSSGMAAAVQQLPTPQSAPVGSVSMADPPPTAAPPEPPAEMLDRQQSGAAGFMPQPQPQPQSEPQSVADFSTEVPAHLATRTGRSVPQPIPPAVDEGESSSTEDPAQ